MKIDFFIEELPNYKYDAIYHEYQTGLNKVILKQMSGVFEFLYNCEEEAIIRDKNTLKSLSLEIGEYLWEVYLDKYSTEKEEVNIRTLVGIWDNKLIVQMTDNNTIVLIDLSDGQITTEIQNIQSYFPKEGPWGFGWHYYKEDKYAFLLQQNRYLRINLENQQVETLWIPENKNLNIQQVSYDENYAYFMACDGYHVQPDILGVFDRKALKIVWQHDQPIYSSQPPQSDGNKLYCLDTGCTLHIFEREKLNP